MARRPKKFSFYYSRTTLPKAGNFTAFLDGKNMGSVNFGKSIRRK